MENTQGRDFYVHQKALKDLQQIVSVRLDGRSGLT